MTKVVRVAIDANLNASIEAECVVRQAAGFVLASSFVLGTELVLIFQK